MALLEDVFESPNLWVGVGIALAAPVVLPVLGGVVRPLAKAAIKGYLATAEVLTSVAAGAVSRVGELLATPVEQFQDLVEEAMLERAVAAASAVEAVTTEEVLASTSHVECKETEQAVVEAGQSQAAAAGETPTPSEPGAVEATTVPPRPRKKPSF